MSVEALLAVQKLTAKTSHACFRVLMTLAEHSDEHGCNTWPSIDRIAAEAQTDEKTVRRSLAKLQEDGLIAGDRGRGRGNTTVWRLLFPVLPLKKAALTADVPALVAPGKEGVAPGIPAIKEGVTPGIDAAKEGLTPGIEYGKEGVTPGIPSIKEGVEPVKEGLTPPEPKKESKKESKSSLRSLCDASPSRDEFEEWWQAYPRKIGKDDARKAYAKKVKNGVTPVALLEAVQQQRWNLIVRYRPYPATWLNGGRWQDDPEAAAPVEVLPPARASTWSERNSDEAVMRAAGLWPPSGDDAPQSMLLEHVP